jgi:hypothetical protein
MASPIANIAGTTNTPAIDLPVAPRSSAKSGIVAASWVSRTRPLGGQVQHRRVIRAQEADILHPHHVEVLDTPLRPVTIRRAPCSCRASGTGSGSTASDIMTTSLSSIAAGPESSTAADSRAVAFPVAFLACQRTCRPASTLAMLDRHWIPSSSTHPHHLRATAAARQRRRHHRRHLFRPAPAGASARPSRAPRRRRARPRERR